MSKQETQPQTLTGYLKDGEESNNNSETPVSINASDLRSMSVQSGKSLLQPTPKLSWKVKFFYSLGHIYNDLIVSVWFSYTLLFFKFQFSGVLAGVLILVGQFADAIASPFVGFESDRSAHVWLCARYGRRKTWHLIGTIMNTISVPFVYNQCLNCEDSPQYARFIYYAVLIIIWQAGWAATQVSHVSLITDLTRDTNERITLNAYRQAATIASNICVYTITLLVIGFDDEGTIRKEDLPIFTKVSYIVCAIGIVFSVLFHLFIREPEYIPKPRKVRQSVLVTETKKFLEQTRGSQGIITLLANKRDETAAGGSVSSISYSTDPEEFERRLKQAKVSQKRLRDWFRSLSFWKICLMYTLARMFVNVTQVYTPLYLQYYLILPKRTIAVIPFSTYFAGLIFSFAAKPISFRFGSRVTLIVGSLFGIAASVWMIFGDDYAFKTYHIYAVSAFIGIGGTALLISTLALTSDLIGGNTHTGAFVFAAMSFFDKITNGFMIAILEQFKPTESDPSDGPISVMNVERIEYYKYIMITMSGLPAILVLVGLATIVKTVYGRKSRASSVVSSIAHCP